MEQEKESHWSRYKHVYLTSGSIILVSTTLVLGYKLGSAELASRNVNGILNYKANPIQNNIVVHLERRGHPGNKILCNQTGEVFASQNRAAMANGINPSQLSKHLAGFLDEVGGLTFEKLGEMI